MSRVIVEAGRLDFAERPHYLKALDRRVGRFQSFEASHRADPLLWLVWDGFEHIVQVLDLTVLGRFRAFALSPQPSAPPGRVHKSAPCRC